MSITLESVKDSINHWRRTRNKPGAIPKEIWDEIIQLTEKYPKGEICKELKISGQQLKNKLNEQTNDEAINFVEIADDKIPCSSNNQNIATNSQDKQFSNPVVNTKTQILQKNHHSIELSRADGATIKLNLSHDLLLTVLNNFLGGFHVTNNA